MYLLHIVLAQLASSRYELVSSHPISVQPISSGVLGSVSAATACPWVNIIANIVNITGRYRFIINSLSLDVLYRIIIFCRCATLKYLLWLTRNSKGFYMLKKTDVVLFDFDGTLSARDSNVEFARYCMRHSIRP